MTAALVALAVVSTGAGAATAGRAKPLTFPVSEDTFVNEAYPDASFARNDALKVDDNPKIALLRFEVRGISGTPASAKVRLYTAQGSAPVSVHQVRWTAAASDTTYKTKPSVGARIASSSALKANSWTTIDVSSAVKKNGVVTLAVTRDTKGPDTVFHSKESAKAPTLVVQAAATSTTSTPTRPTTTKAPTTSTTAKPSTPVTTATTVRPTTPTTVSPSGRPFLAYTADSYFRTPLPDNAPIDAESAKGIALTKSLASRAYPGITGVEGSNWGMPYAMSSCSDPLFKFTGTLPKEVAFLATQGFHAPSSLVTKLTGTSDSPLVIVDRCGNSTMPKGLTIWAYGAAAGPGNTISVRNAGAFQHDSNGLDKRVASSTSDLNFRSRGAIPDAMVIRNDLLTWAQSNNSDLGHVLHMFWWETDTSAGSVFPMVGAEGGKFGWGAEGIRIRIKPDVDLSKRSCSPSGLVVARTLQRYGAYLGDNSGGTNTAIKAEQGSSMLTKDALKCVTWDDFVFVQRGWHG